MFHWCFTISESQFAFLTDLSFQIFAVVLTIQISIRLVIRNLRQINSTGYQKNSLKTEKRQPFKNIHALNSKTKKFERQIPNNGIGLFLKWIYYIYLLLTNRIVPYYTISISFDSSYRELFNDTYIFFISVPAKISISQKWHNKVQLAQSSQSPFYEVLNSYARFGTLGLVITISGSYRPLVSIFITLA